MDKKITFIIYGIKLFLFLLSSCDTRTVDTTSIRQEIKDRKAIRIRQDEIDKTTEYLSNAILDSIYTKAEGSLKNGIMGIETENIYSLIGKNENYRLFLVDKSNCSNQVEYIKKQFEKYNNAYADNQPYKPTVIRSINPLELIYLRPVVNEENKLIMWVFEWNKEIVIDTIRNNRGL